MGPQSKYILNLVTLIFATQTKAQFYQTLFPTLGLNICYTFHHLHKRIALIRTKNPEEFSTKLKGLETVCR